MIYSFKVYSREIYFSSEYEISKLARLLEMPEYELAKQVIIPLSEKQFLEINGYRLRMHVSIDSWNGTAPIFVVSIAVKPIGDD